MQTTTIRMANGDLLNLLANPLLFVLKDVKYPQLQAIHITVDGNNVCAEGTDRYSLGLVNLKAISVTGDDLGAHVLIPADIATQMIKTLKALPKSYKRSMVHDPDSTVKSTETSQLTIVHDNDFSYSVKLETPMGEQSFMVGQDFQAQYPNLKHLIWDGEQNHPAPYSAVNPNHFIRFCKVADYSNMGVKDQPMIIVHGKERGSVKVQRFSWFDGLYMIINLDKMHAGFEPVTIR